MNNENNIDIIKKPAMQTEISEIKFPNEISIIDSVMDGYKNYQILSVALKMGIFDKMAELGPSSFREIAESASINRMFIRSILSALEDLNFVKSEEKEYMLTKLSKNFLCKMSPLYQGDLILSVDEDESQWNELETILKRKKPPKISQEAPDEHQISSLAQQCIRGEVQSVLESISSRPEFSGSKYLLDIGGSHGLYSIALCQENRDLTSTIIEKEQIAPITASLVSEYGMSNRIKVQEGKIENLLNGVSEEGYDIILVSHLLYQYRREMGETLGKIVEMLNPRGTLVLNHRFCTPACDIKPGAGVREIDRALTSFGHPLCHPEGLKEVLENLGFINVSLIPHETALGYAVLCIGTKETKSLEKILDTKEIASEYPANGDDRCC